MSTTIFYLLDTVVQVYGRAEGFEHYLESIFGPSRQFNSKQLHDQIPKFRWTRNAPSDEAIKSKVDGVGDIIENEFGKPKVGDAICAMQRNQYLIITGVSWNENLW